MSNPNNNQSDLLSSGEKDDDVAKLGSCGEEYFCVECLEPSSTLYRRYSAPNAVILSRCAACGSNVDPYVERELLLIFMDIALLRVAAYRHLLFHRSDLFGILPLRMNPSTTIQEVVKRSLKIIFSLSLLETYLKYEAFNQYQNSMKEQILSSSLSYNYIFYSSPSVPHFFFFSLSEHVLMVLGTALFLNKIITFLPSSSKLQFWMRIHNAILIPQIFKFLTVYTHIWENSPTIRILGSIFVLCYQWMAINTVVEQHQRVIRAKLGEITLMRKPFARIMYGIPLLFGIILRSLVPLFLSWTIYYNDEMGLKKKHQCSSWSIHSSFFEEEICIT